ncbi:hypothetical protein [Streptomyces sp. NPDC029674]|uniref:hypothetical protein n=1 Tax=Streptomyces sp. NPDC029674 TaxID=3365297 RepID=UPI00384D8C00
MLTGPHYEGSSLILRAPWWLNLIALATAIAPCLVLGLPWYVAAVAALITGTIADRTWAAIKRRRGHNG